MPRSRSRSPKRDRKRSRSRDRDRDRHRRHRRSRSRSRDKKRSRSRDRDRDRDRRHGRDDRNRSRRPAKPRRDDSGDEDMVIYQNIDRVPMPEEEIQNMPADEQDLMRVMGFSGFDTTKNKQVVGNNQYAANICKKRRYRQYMNRKGGFNRPLDFIA